jgi:hypothetical protein
MLPAKTLSARTIARFFALIAVNLALWRVEASDVPAASWATLIAGGLNGIYNPKILPNPTGGFYLYSSGDRPLIKFNNDGSIAWEVKFDRGVNDVREVSQLDILDNGDLIGIVGASSNARVFGQQFVNDGRWLVQLHSADASPVFVKDLGNCWITAVKARPGGGYFVAGENWDIARIGADTLPIATNQVFVAQFTTAFDWATTGELTTLLDGIQAIRTSGAGAYLRIWLAGDASRAWTFASTPLAEGAYAAILGPSGEMLNARVVAPGATTAAFELRPSGGAHFAANYNSSSNMVYRLDQTGAQVWNAAIGGQVGGLTATDETYVAGTVGENTFAIAYDSLGHVKWQRNNTTRSTHTATGAAVLADGRLAISGVTPPSGIWIDDFFLHDFSLIQQTYYCGYVATFPVSAIAAPVFREQPRDQTFAIRGETVTLHTDVYSPNGVALEWYKDGNVIDGQTSPDLVLANVQAASNGKYFVEAQNGGGLTRSKEVQVAVNDVSVSTIDGTDAADVFDSPRSPIVLPDGSILVADPPQNVIKRVSSSGIATFAGNGQAGSNDGAALDAMFSAPSGLAFEFRYADPIVYVADRGNNSLRRIHISADTNDALTVDRIDYDQFVAPSNVATLDGMEAVVLAAQTSIGLWKYNEGAVDSLAGSVDPGAIGGILFDERGNLCIADSTLNEIRRRDLENQALPIASNLSGPAGMTIDVSGNLYVTERGGNTIRKISPSGTKTILAGSGFSGLQNGSANQAKFNAPDGICFRNGSLIVADTGNHCVREIRFTPASASASGDAQIQVVFGNSLSVSVSASVGGTFVIESTGVIAPGAQWQTEGTVAAGTGPALNISKPTSTRFYRARKP